MIQIPILKHKASQKLTLFVAIILTLIQCTQQQVRKKEGLEYRRKLSEKLATIGNEDSLKIILHHFSKKNNDAGKMICLNHLGSAQRASARYTDAIDNHHQSLTLALKLDDTVEIVQALNNLAIDYNRIGKYSESTELYSQSLHYAENWSGLNTPMGAKNIAKSLNGIGNISFIFGNYSEAENFFRRALKHESLLQDSREMAINYTNLGSIFEVHQQFDSAYAYYQKSLRLNKNTKSNVGVGLSLLKIGGLYEKEHKFDLALNEYKNSINMLDSINNTWHWLKACLSIARVHLITDNMIEFKKYIDLAANTAEDISTPEHLAEIYWQKHKYYSKLGNYQLALEKHKQHIALKDSLQGTQKTSLYMQIRHLHEHNKITQKLQQVELASTKEKQNQTRIIYLSWIIIIVSLIILASLYYAFRQRIKANKILREMETVRSDFFTNITHELRSPLTIIQGFNQQMLEKKNITADEKRAFMRSIERQSEKLLNLVTQLLDIAKLKKGSDDSQWKYGDIIAYSQMTAEAYRIYASEKGIELIFYSSINSLEMDFIPNYIDQIIDNLLINAIKHTSAGGKIVFIIDKKDSQNTISLSIKDTGEGISKEELERIFDIFYQSPNTRNASGSGIGLAFTKIMVEKMKGKIDVESDIGRGAIFTITLPVMHKHLPGISAIDQEKTSITNHFYKRTDIIEDEDEIGNEDMAVDTENKKKPLILIVEDNRDNILYYKTILKNKYEIISAWNGEEGVKTANENIPDLVITDLMMPVMDGYEFVSKMKQSRLLNHIPIIMVTAKNTNEDLLKSLRYGVDAFICKPFHQETLLVRIENIFKNRRILKEKYMNTLISSKTDNKKSSDINIEFLQSVTNIIHAELNNPDLSSTFLASKMAMSVSQLNRKINGTTGHSTTSYVLKIKLDKAKKLLANNDMSIAEVSDMCGFYDPSHFSRMFKKEFGVSPSNFKKTAEYIFSD